MLQWPRSRPDVAASQPAWTLALELAPDRSVRAGSKADLAAAIGRGADLRVYTEFLFEEHIVPGGNGDPSQDGLIREVIDFRETILVGDGHVGAITTQRQPLEPPFGFNGTQPRMSFFMYTSDGEQALAGLVFGGVEGAPAPGQRTVEEPPADMPKMGPQEFFDVGTSGPSRNFVYDMETIPILRPRRLGRDPRARRRRARHCRLVRCPRGGADRRSRDQGRDRRPGGGPRDRRAVRRAAEPHGVHARRIRVPPHRAARLRRADAPARPGRPGSPLALRVGRLGRRLGVPPDRWSRRDPPPRAATCRPGRIGPHALHVGGSPARFPT